LCSIKAQRQLYLFFTLLSFTLIHEKCGTTLWLPVFFMRPAESKWYTTRT